MPERHEASCRTVRPPTRSRTRRWAAPRDRRAWADLPSGAPDPSLGQSSTLVHADLIFPMCPQGAVVDGLRGGDQPAMRRATSRMRPTYSTCPGRGGRPDDGRRGEAGRGAAHRAIHKNLPVRLTSRVHAPRGGVRLPTAGDDRYLRATGRNHGGARVEPSGPGPPGWISHSGAMTAFRLGPSLQPCPRSTRRANAPTPPPRLPSGRHGPVGASPSDPGARARGRMRRRLAVVRRTRDARSRSRGAHLSSSAGASARRRLLAAAVERVRVLGEEERALPPLCSATRGSRRRPRRVRGSALVPVRSCPAAGSARPAGADEPGPRRDAERPAPARAGETATESARARARGRDR